MNRRTIFPISCLMLLLLVGAVAVAAQAGSSPQPALTTLGGGHYRLVSLDGAANMIAGGRGYLLWGLPSPELRGSGCCCTYLPCVLRRH